MQVLSLGGRTVYSAATVTGVTQTKLTNHKAEWNQRFQH